jgi:hypothetical protein
MATLMTAGAIVSMLGLLVLARPRKSVDDSSQGR